MMSSTSNLDMKQPPHPKQQQQQQQHEPLRVVSSPDNIINSTRYNSIQDIPSCEFATDADMIIFVNRSKQQVLLQVPNQLGWKYHYGCCSSTGVGEKNENAVICMAWEALGIEHDPPSSENQQQRLRLLRQVGLMLFTFITTASSTEEKKMLMRVRAYEFDLELLQQQQQQQSIGVGNFYDYDQIPYDQMWSGDKYWMPKLLLMSDDDDQHYHGACYFEGHFVFDGPTGGTSAPLLRHSIVSI